MCDRDKLRLRNMAESGCACVSAVPEIASLHVSMWQFLSRAQLIACFSAYLNA